MSPKHFIEEMHPAQTEINETYYIARIGDVVLRYDVKLEFFDIMNRPNTCILDGTDLRTAKAFIKLEKDNV